MPQNQLVALAVKGVKSPQDWAKIITALVQIILQNFACLSENVLTVEYKRPWLLHSGIIGDFMQSLPPAMGLRTKVVVLYQAETTIGELKVQDGLCSRITHTELLTLTQEGQLIEFRIEELGKCSGINPIQLSVVPTTVELLVQKFGGVELLKAIKSKLTVLQSTNQNRVNSAGEILTELSVVASVMECQPAPIFSSE